ncbi:MAG TPA: FAD-dependent oxidoreductase [Pseudomonadota bacterium]|nr:FAD-dependent oxidoreductase [Pseudomonadota bacterium]
MSSGITRRDFIDGIACTVVAAAAHSSAHGQAPAADDYPPAAQGFRGSRSADYKTAHAVRDGMTYRIDGYPVDESVDYVIVGAGIGGLSAAYYLRQAKPNCRVLILDNHDDFGGHARRNEFQVDGRLLIGYGGSEAIQAPKAMWTPTSRQLLSELGVHLERFETADHINLYPGLGMSFGLLCRREVFGTDKLVTGDPQRSLATDIPAALQHGRPIADFANDCPLSDAQRRTLVALYTEQRAIFPGKTVKERRELLSRISYADFLVRYWDVDPIVLQMFAGRTLDLLGMSAEWVPATEAAESDYPGFRGTGLGPSEDNLEPYIYHFPDGNASIARLLVRKLIPGVAPGTTMEDIVTAKFAYRELDRDASPVRLRLSSTAVRIQNTSSHVDVLYVRGDKARRVRCKNVIYTGYECMLPYICADLPAAQREADAGNVKLPMVYVTVALRNWRPFAATGVHFINNPTGFYSVIKLDYPVSLGDYQFAKSPDEPILLHLVHVPRAPVPLPDFRATLRAARGVLYARPFSDFEAAVRDELARCVGSAGFDPDRDIAAITVNRWGHGYAFDSNHVTDPGAPRSEVRTSRQAIGRISIGGSDAAWDAWAYTAIDESHRAVAEVMARPG